MSLFLQSASEDWQRAQIIRADKSGNVARVETLLKQGVTPRLTDTFKQRLKSKKFKLYALRLIG